MLLLLRTPLNNGVILRIRYVSETEEAPEATSGWREKWVRTSEKRNWTIVLIYTLYTQWLKHIQNNNLMQRGLERCETFTSQVLECSNK